MPTNVWVQVGIRLSGVIQNRAVGSGVKHAEQWGEWGVESAYLHEFRTRRMTYGVLIHWKAAQEYEVFLGTADFNRRLMKSIVRSNPTARVFDESQREQAA